MFNPADLGILWAGGGHVNCGHDWTLDLLQRGRQRSQPLRVASDTKRRGLVCVLQPESVWFAHVVRYQRHERGQAWDLGPERDCWGQRRHGRDLWDESDHEFV